MMFPRNRKTLPGTGVGGTHDPKAAYRERAGVEGDYQRGPDGIQALVEKALQDVLEAEMDEALGAQKSERTEARLGYRA